MNDLSLKVVIVLACVLAPLCARAGCSGYACNSIYIDHLYTNNDSIGTVYIYTTGDESAMTGCTAFQGNAFTLLVNTDAGKAVYGTLLAALAADRLIDVVGKVGSSTCEVSYIRYRRQ